MNRKTTLIFAICALLCFSSLALTQIQGEKRLPREAERKKLPREAEKMTTRKLDRDSPELKTAFADQKFLDACEILAANREMFLVDTAQLSSDGEQSLITFAVVKEATQEPGQYKQLVYSFDGKDGAIYFNEKNPKYVATRAKSISNRRFGWTPPWWPGTGGGSTGFGGGFDWTDWHQVAVDNCHANLVCPFIHVGKMVQQERTSLQNSSIKQTRWLLVSCGCS